MNYNEDERKIVEAYMSGIAMTNIRKATGVRRSPIKIKEILVKHGVTFRAVGTWCRKYNVNDHFFDYIDTPRKAYFLGLLYADGCNYEKRHTIQIQLQKRDCDVLEKLNVLIDNSRPIRYFTRKTKTGKIKEYGMLRINSQILSDRLNTIGCVYKKSNILAAPPKGVIPQEYINSFFLGFFDGDGSVTYYKKLDQYSIMFICNDTFKDYVMQEIRKVTSANITATLRRKKKSSMPLWQVTITSIPGMADVSRWMMSSETDQLQLARKRERLLAIIEKNDNLPRTKEETRQRLIARNRRPRKMNPDRTYTLL